MAEREEDPEQIIKDLKERQKLVRELLSEIAKTKKQLFEEFVDQGFSEEQAIEIVKYTSIGDV